MITNFVSYKVKVREHPFTTEEGKNYPATAQLSFYDEVKKEIACVEAGYIDAENVYKLIDEGKSICMDYCYIENFSLSIYRKSRKLPKDEQIKIQGFSARNAFFEASFLSDFSFALFSDGAIDFQGTHFINGRVSFNSVNFGVGDKNFSYVFFAGGDIDFANAVFSEGNVSFKNSQFRDGVKDFQYAEFGDGEVSFTNTDFGNGDVSFINTNFGDGDVTFKVARFGTGKVDFHFATFGKGDISFERVEFGEGKKDFRKIEFDRGKVNFNRSEFGNGDITFEGAQLKGGRLTFKRTTFGSGNINFELAEFENTDLLFESVDFGQGNVSFHSSTFNDLSLKSCHLDNYFDLRVAKCNHLDLSDTIVRDIIDLQPYKSEVKIQFFDISGMRLIGRIDVDWHANRVYSMIAGQEFTTYREKAEQFRTLKENYGNTGQYTYEDLAYIQFKRYEQKADLHDSLDRNRSSAIWQYPFYFLKSLLFDKMGLYATSPVRVLLSLFIVYLTISMIYFVCPYIFESTYINCITEEMSFLDRLFTTLYYSLITFATVGYGDCSPVGFLRFFAAIEGIIGVYMMSYFTVAFARKILR